MSRDDSTQAAALVETPTKSGGPTIEKIQNFAKLPVGWDSGAGVPASERLVDDALRLHRSAEARVLETNAFPGTNGSILLTFYAEGECLEITLNPKGDCDCTLEVDGTVVSDIEGLTLDEAESAIDDFGR